MKTRPKLNREWHLTHKMPKNPTLDQRVEWHIEHSKNCGCREMPDSIRQIVGLSGLQRKRKGGGRRDSIKPEQVVQKQLEAFNARDIEGLLSIYADDAQMFEHPCRLLASGSAELRERFVVRFEEPDLHAALRQRMVMGQIVVDYEEVTRTFPEGRGKIELVMIYEVQNGRIAKAWVISGAKRLDGAVHQT